MDQPPVDLNQDDWTLADDVWNHCARDGFFKVVGHGIDDAEIAEAFCWARRFFTLPDDAKTEAGRPPGPGPNRGYAGIGQEKLSGISGYNREERASGVADDVKESFDLGPTHDLRFPTPWPRENAIPKFRKFMNEFSSKCDKVHNRLLRILESALGVPESQLLAMSDGANGELRITHYPAVQLQRLRTGKTFRIAEHTDTGILTLLFQDSVGGLEVEDPTERGAFRPIVTSHQSEMIVNVGDTLQRWTDGKLRSANHRVTAPQACQDLVVPARYSIGFFGKANPDAMVRPLPQFSKREGKDEGDMMTAADFYSKLQTLTFPSVTSAQTA